MEGWERVSTPSVRIREAMDKAGMKQVDLAEKTGMSKSAISRYISGEYEPKQKALYRMGRALGVAEMWLAGYDIPMERPAAQKENDALAGVVERIKKERDFRQLILKIGQLKPQQLEAVKNLLDAFPQE